MEEIFQNLNINWSVWLVNFLGFGLLLAVANKMVFVPIGKVIAERQADVQNTYDQLDAEQREMQTLKADYEARLGAIEAEGRERINNMIKEAQTTRDAVLSDANTRAQQLVSSAEAEVAREKEQALITLRTQVADLAIGAAERVIGENLNDDRSRRLVDDFITSGGGAAPDYSAPVRTTAPVATASPVATPVVSAPATAFADATPFVETPSIVTAPAAEENPFVFTPSVATDTGLPAVIDAPASEELTVVSPVGEASLTDTTDDAVTIAKRPRTVRRKATDMTTEEGAA